MAFQFLTLDEVLEQIRHRGNLAGYEQRHGKQRLIQMWNASNQDLRELVSTHDDSPFMKRTAPAALPTTPSVTGETFVTVDWPTDALSIHSVHVKRDEYWRPLKEVQPMSLHDYQGRRGLSRLSGLPVVYALGNLPFGANQAEVPGTIDIAPIPTEGEFSIWYTQAWQPLSAGESVVNSVGAFLEWTIWDTIIKCTGKNDKKSHVYTLALMERDRCQAKVERRAMRLSEQGDQQPRNARNDGSHYHWRYYNEDD